MTWLRAPRILAEEINREWRGVLQRKPACAVVVLLPVGVGEVDDFHGSSTARRVDEAVLADVDADMGETRAHGVEEYKVAWLKFIKCYGNAMTHLIKRRAGQQHACRLTKNELHKPAAIEAGFWRCTTPFVGYAHEAHSVQHQIVSAAED